MSSGAGPDPEQLLGLARAGSGPALGQLLELYRSYLAILARLQIGRRLVDTDPFLFGSHVVGSLTRLSTVTLLNVTAGAGSVVPTYIVEGPA